MNNRLKINDLSLVCRDLGLSNLILPIPEGLPALIFSAFVLTFIGGWNFFLLIKISLVSFDQKKIQPAPFHIDQMDLQHINATAGINGKFRECGLS